MNDSINNIINEWLNNLKETLVSISRDITIDEIADIVSKKLDEIIIYYVKNGADYNGGRLYVNLYNNEYFYLSYEMWFKISGKWNKMNNSTKKFNINILANESIKELSDKKIIEYEIVQP